MEISTKMKEQKSFTGSLPRWFFLLVGGMLLLFFFPENALAATAHLKNNAPKFIAKTESTYGGFIAIAAHLYGVDPDLILAVIVVESEGNPRAVSRRGAQGLMQLMPQTAKALGAKDPKEPLQNILAGTKYLKELEENYAYIDSTDEVLVAYNMGPTKAKRWLARSAPERHPYVASVNYVYSMIKERDGAFGEDITGITMEKIADTVSGAAEPILNRPRSLSLAAFPMNLPSGRRNDVAIEN